MYLSQQDTLPTNREAKILPLYCGFPPAKHPNCLPPQTSLQQLRAAFLLESLSTAPWTKQAPYHPRFLPLQSREQDTLFHYASSSNRYSLRNTPWVVKMLDINNHIIPMLMYKCVRGDPLYRWNPARKLSLLLPKPTHFPQYRNNARDKTNKFFPVAKKAGRIGTSNKSHLKLN